MWDGNLGDWTSKSISRCCSVVDWPNLNERIFNHLHCGSWLEQLQIDFESQCNSQSLKGTWLLFWYQSLETAGIIPRWKISPNTSVNLAAFANGYPKPELALIDAQALKEAADEWSTLELGVQFKWVAKLEMLHSPSPSQAIKMASSLMRFPDDVDLNVLNVYNAAFGRRIVQYLTNIFMHNLGHVLGHHHEFAPELEDSTDHYAVQISPRSPLSVMGMSSLLRYNRLM